MKQYDDGGGNNVVFAIRARCFISVFFVVVWVLLIFFIVAIRHQICVPY